MISFNPSTTVDISHRSNVSHKETYLLSEERFSHDPVIQLITGARKPRDEASDSDSSEDGQSDGDTDEFPRQPSQEPTTELQQTVLDVVDIIDCLFRLSITIRNPSPHDRLVKAASVDTMFFERWDIQHVNNKFPTAKVSLWCASLVVDGFCILLPIGISYCSTRQGHFSTSTVLEI
jgi:hypothetical protein